MSDDLRRTLAALSARERQAMRQQADQAAERWTECLPRVAAVWEAFGALVADVDTLQRARQAADPPEHTMRQARRPRA